MKHLTRKLIIIPIVIFLITNAFIVFGYYFVLKNFREDIINYEFSYFLNKKKDQLKHEIEFVKYSIESLKDIVYKDLEDSFKNILYKAFQEYKSVPSKEKWLKEHFSADHFFFAVISKNFIFPNNAKLIKKGEKYFIKLKDKEYFFVFKRLKDNTLFGIALPDRLIEERFLREVRSLLDKFNKNRIEYIAMGKIIDFNTTTGDFGKIIYMPQKLKRIEGKILNYNKGDIKGNLYRKKYFEAFKRGEDELFLSYYFKNPKTLQYEKKYSFFTIIRPENLVLVKGFYESEIKEIYKNLIIRYEKLVKHMFIVLFSLSLFIFIVGAILIIFLSKRVINSINEDYEVLKSELFYKFYYDEVTNLPNRNKFLEEKDKYHSLLIIDIDDFSIINEVYGFEFGDELLKFVAKYLTQKFDNVYRFGSDEFVVAFYSLVNSNLLEKLTSEKLKFKDLEVTMTIGASNVKPLLETSEMALKLAQKDKVKRFYLYDKNMFSTQKEKLSKINLLKTILQEEGIIPFYQCIVDKNENIIKYEALMRLKYKDKIYSPFEFLEFIKEIKLYDQFARLMISRVIEDIKKGVISNVSVNLSFEDVVNETTRKFILNKIDEKVAKNLTVEILESEEIENYELIFKFLEELKNKGVKIAIDDFGSGYSNFVQILKINPDFIKIDASLVKNLDDEKYFKLVNLIIEFCKEFDIKSVAEFVDSKEKFEKLKKLGVDYFQGFYFCKPSKIDDIILKKGKYENRD